MSNHGTGRSGASAAHFKVALPSETKTKSTQLKITIGTAGTLGISGNGVKSSTHCNATDGGNTVVQYVSSTTAYNNKKITAGGGHASHQDTLGLRGGVTNESTAVFSTDSATNGFSKSGTTASKGDKCPDGHKTRAVAGPATTAVNNAFCTPVCFVQMWLYYYVDAIKTILALRPYKHPWKQLTTEEKKNSALVKAWNNVYATSTAADTFKHFITTRANQDITTYCPEYQKENNVKKYLKWTKLSQIKTRLSYISLVVIDGTTAAKVNDLSVWLVDSTTKKVSFNPAVESLIGNNPNKFIKSNGKKIYPGSGQSLSYEWNKVTASGNLKGYVRVTAT